MPLIKSGSDAARAENIKREMDAGKPQAQAVAIGYSVQRAAGAAKGRATQAHARGKISSGERARIHAQADRAIGHTFHSHRGTK
jgi:hypothetical protein